MLSLFFTIILKVRYYCCLFFQHGTQRLSNETKLIFGARSCPATQEWERYVPGYQ